MSTFIRSALVALVMVTGVSSLASAATHDGRDYSNSSDQYRTTSPDFWDKFNAGK